MTYNIVTTAWIHSTYFCCLERTCWNRRYSVTAWRWYRGINQCKWYHSLLTYSFTLRTYSEENPLYYGHVPMVIRMWWSYWLRKEPILAWRTRWVVTCRQWCNLSWSWVQDGWTPWKIATTKRYFDIWTMLAFTLQQSESNLSISSNQPYNITQTKRLLESYTEGVYQDLFIGINLRSDIASFQG